MTEAEWLACTEPGKMVAYLSKETHDRKLRLFVCACCRRAWDWFDDESCRAAVEVAERFAAGKASKRQLTVAKKASGEAVARAAAARDLSKKVACELAWSTTRNSTTAAKNSVWVFRGEADKQWLLSFLRDIFGNPFRPITLDPAWRTANVIGIAQSIYDERAFDRMPILADALEDAGCTQQELLKHCREPGEHVRGCFVVDLLLGKSETSRSPGMLLEILQVVTGVFVVVYDGQHALKFTLGRAGDVVGPGIHWKWPIVQRYRVEETKDSTIELEPQTIQLRDDLVYEVGARAVYQIVDLRKAIIEVDNLVTGLRNRMVLVVQRVVKAQDRDSVRDLPRMVAAVLDELRPLEEQWGVKFREFGFSTFSPTPETLEITQLRKLAQEKLALYLQFRRDNGLGEEAAVALISGAVMAVHGSDAAAREDRIANLHQPGTALQAPQKKEDPWKEGAAEDGAAPDGEPQPGS